MYLKITRKIFSTGRYSFALTLPKALLGLFGWRDGTIVEVVPNFKRKVITLKLRSL